MQTAADRDFPIALRIMSNQKIKRTQMWTYNIYGSMGSINRLKPLQDHNTGKYSPMNQHAATCVQARLDELDGRREVF